MLRPTFQWAPISAKPADYRGYGGAAAPTEAEQRPNPMQEPTLENTIVYYGVALALGKSPSKAQPIS